MAITFVREATASSSFSFDGGSGANRCMVLATAGDTTDNVTAAAWNSESFTFQGKIKIPSGRFHYIYTLFPVGTGAQTMTITEGGLGVIGSVLLYATVGTVKNPSTTSQTSTTGSLTITANNGDWLVGTYGNNAAQIVAGSNTTQRDILTSSIGQFDSNGVASPTALNFTWGGTNIGNGGVGIAMTPFVAPASNPGLLMALM